MNPSVRNKKRQTVLLLILLMSGIGLAITGYRWYTWPERTWNEFTLALANRDIAAANRLCDVDSLKVGINSFGELCLYIRNEPGAGSVYFPLDSIYRYDMKGFRNQNGPLPENLWQILNGKVPLTAHGVIWYGSLHFRRGKIRFHSDIK
ncbi:hypothetical protein [Gimesia algae]|uniref:Uncharacterized protein n=1 Tax=Gimesia algae TaxID=2527971 RepID=A0A517VN56_9PLAN|nr:hypothetical protein [Gimesia algae]QDT94461.1 hypothetical protein Pan161_61570 [Gimesia algae]